jgi:FkbM family methyltransferase
VAVRRLLEQARVLSGLVRYIVDNPSNEGERTYRLGLAAAWQLYKRTVGLPLVLRLENGLAFVADPVSTNSTGVIYSRVYEPEYTAVARANVIGGGAVIDVGAHVGLFTLQLADLFVEGVCFEPAADNFRLLQRNFRLNELPGFRLAKTALSDKIGELDLLVTGSHSCMNRLDPSVDVPVERSERVPITTLDTHLAATPLRTPLTFIKIDVEGHEIAVLAGARDTFAKARSALAIIENSGHVAIREMISPMGWVVFAITQGGEIRRDEASLARAYNLVACGPDHPLSATR